MLVADASDKVHPHFIPRGIHFPDGGVLTALICVGSQIADAVSGNVGVASCESDTPRILVRSRPELLQPRGLCHRWIGGWRLASGTGISFLRFLDRAFVGGGSSVG